nr:hypothetical protein GCM10025730_09750 [Promicromonospora thailandica]
MHAAHERRTPARLRAVREVQARAQRVRAGAHVPHVEEAGRVREQLAQALAVQVRAHRALGGRAPEPVAEAGQHRLDQRLGRSHDRFEARDGTRHDRAHGGHDGPARPVRRRRPGT